MHNPYENINWGSVEYLPSANHWHCTAKDRFLAIYGTGLKHFALTNYEPSHPTYPLLTNEFFAVTEAEIPSDIVQSPNSEKVHFLDEGMHVSAMGSLAETDGHDWLPEVPYWTWHDKFDYIFANMQYADGGGIIINHPVRSGMTTTEIIEKLNYDAKVLGVEVYNHRSQRDYEQKGYFFDGWDSILAQGYKCFGFCSPDEHSYPVGFIAGDDMRDANFGLGRNVLLVPAKTGQEALKAYRNGNFYGAYYGDRIKFTIIEYEGNSFHVETDGAEKIEFISYSLYGTNVVENPIVTVLGSGGSFAIDTKIVFVRAVAYEDANANNATLITTEQLYTQPLMLKTTAEIQSSTPLLNRVITNKYVKHNGVWRSGRTYAKIGTGFREISSIKTN